MKVNKVLLLKVLGSSFNHHNSLSEACLYLHRFQLIDAQAYHDINNIIEKDGSLKKILEYLKINSDIIEFITFFNNYYSFNESIEISLNLIEERNSLKKDLISSLIYPSILIILSTIAIYFVSSSIVPQLFVLNENQDNTYNIIVLILKYFPIILLIITLLMISVFIIIIILLKKDFNKYISILINIKGLNYFIRLIASMSFSLYFKEIIKNMPLSKNSIEILKEQSDNIFIQFISESFIKELEQGIHIFDLISDSTYLSNDLKHTILIAKDSNNMAILLNDYYKVKMTILRRSMKTFIAIFVPVVISVVGVVLILMYLLIMLPIINMSTSI